MMSPERSAFPAPDGNPVLGSPRSMSERLPRQFGKYVLLKSLARGGMGEIYLAASDQPGGLAKLCVIKKIIAEKTDRAKVNRFLDEAKVVLRLSHANLVSTFDAGDAAGELFIAMELVEGKDLREIWNRCVRTRTRIPLDVALYVVRETARALAYVHTYADLRLVHRDVAPPNILLSYYGEVKLTDFGLARSAEACSDSAGSATRATTVSWVGEGGSGSAGSADGGGSMRTAEIGPERAPFCGDCVTSVRGVAFGFSFSPRNCGSVSVSMRSRSVASSVRTPWYSVRRKSATRSASARGATRVITSDSARRSSSADWNRLLRSAASARSTMASSSGAIQGRPSAA